MSTLSLSGPSYGPITGERPKKVVFLLHGVGSHGHDLISLAHIWAPSLPDTLFLSPHGPEPFDGGGLGYQWFSLANFDPAKMLEGLRVIAPLVKNYMQEHLEALNLTFQDALLVGFSQGAAVALCLGLQLDNLAGVLGYSGRVLCDTSIMTIASSPPPVMLIHGEQDEVVPIEYMWEMQEFLQEYNVNLTTHACKRLGHSINQEGVDLGLKFIKNCFLKA